MFSVHAQWRHEPMAGAPRTKDGKITSTVVEEPLPDTDLLEHYCRENEQDDAHATWPGAEFVQRAVVTGSPVAV